MILNRKQCLYYTWCHRKYIVSVCHKRIHQSCILHLRKPSSAKKTENSLPNTSNMTDSGLFQTQKAISYGNTNFYGIEGDEGVIYTDEMPKRQQLIQDSIKNLQPKPKCEFKTVSFGAVRLDSENLPTYYSRYSTGEERPELAQGDEKLENTNLENEPSVYTSKSVPDFMTNKNEKFDSTIGSINSETEQNQSFSLSNLEKDYSVNHKTLKLEPDLLKSNSLANSSAYNFGKKESDSYHTQESNFIDNFYFPSVKDSENTLGNEESVHESKNKPAKNDISSKSDFYATLLNEIEQNKTNSPFTSSSNYIDEQYFPETIAKDSPAEPNQNDSNYIDNQYFSDIGSIKSISEKPSNNINEQYISEANAKDFPEKSNEIDCSYIDKQYFSGNDSIKSNVKSIKSRLVGDANNSDLNFKNSDSSVDKSYMSNKNTEIQTSQILSDEILKNEQFTLSNFSLPSDANKKSKIEIPKIDPDSMPIGMNKDTKENFSLNLKNIIKSGKSEMKTVLSGSTSASKAETETAYDFVKKLREKQTLSDDVKRGISAKKEKKVDSKGFRILKHQVPSLMYFTRDEMLELLKENILYIDQDIVILNKPYNLVIHESSSTKNNACLSTYLSDFAQLIGERDQSPELFTIHRLDKETTGCLLLARNKEAAQRMKSLFAQRKIIKTYWIVTTKVPDPMQGVIDIPISEGKIGEKSRMVLHPDLPQDTPYVNHSKCGKRAVTFYSVIATSGNAALVEVKPETGIKHQIRVHFGFGLSCPILGDHKYTYLDKFVPQKLQSDLLQKLHVRQSKVRHIPLHIHSKHLLIPQYANQKNLYISAPLPHHMSENLRFLKFKKK